MPYKNKEDYNNYQQKRRFQQKVRASVIKEEFLARITIKQNKPAVVPVLSVKQPTEEAPEPYTITHNSPIVYNKRILTNEDKINGLNLRYRFLRNNNINSTEQDKIRNRISQINGFLTV